MRRSEPEQPEFLTLPAAARRAGVGLRQIHRARNNGEIAVFRVGGWNRVRWRDVLDWIEERRESIDGSINRSSEGATKGA